MADLCKELSKASLVAGKPAANEDLETMEIPTEVSIADPHTNAELLGNLLQDYEHKFEPLPEDQKLTKLCSNAGFSKNIGKGQFFITLDEEEGLDEKKNIMSRVHIASKRRSIPSERVVSRKHENRRGLGCEGLLSSKSLRCRNHGRISVSRQKQFLGFEL